MRSLFPSTYDSADVLISAGCSTFVGSCPKSVITFQPVAATGRSSDIWLR